MPEPARQDNAHCDGQPKPDLENEGATFFADLILRCFTKSKYQLSQDYNKSRPRSGGQ